MVSALGRHRQGRSTGAGHKRIRSCCLSWVHGRLPGVALGTASHCAARFWQGRVMGLKPRQQDQEPERGRVLFRLTALAGRNGLN